MHNKDQRRKQLIEQYQAQWKSIEMREFTFENRKIQERVLLRLWVVFFLVAYSLGIIGVFVYRFYDLVDALQNDPWIILAILMALGFLGYSFWYIRLYGQRQKAYRAWQRELKEALDAFDAQNEET